MPIYPMKCAAGHAFEVTCAFERKPTTCIRDGCGCAVDDDYRAKNIIGGVKPDRSLGNKHLSVTKFYHPKQARQMAEALGDVGARCIKPDGSVVYEHRGDAAKFAAAERRYKQRELQKAHDNEGHAIESKKRGMYEPIEGRSAADAAPPTPREQVLIEKARRRKPTKQPKLGRPRLT